MVNTAYYVPVRQRSRRMDGRGALRNHLVALGFTAEDIAELDRAAEEVREPYASQCAGERSGMYSGWQPPSDIAAALLIASMIAA